jgi:hypothetical protein
MSGINHTESQQYLALNHGYCILVVRLKMYTDAYQRTQQKASYQFSSVYSSSSPVAAAGFTLAFDSAPHRETSLRDP